MLLERNKNYTLKDLAEFFEITHATMRKIKNKKLEELKDYADYEIIMSEAGRFKYAHITNVYCDTYMKSYKKPFVEWLEAADRFEETGEDGISNTTVITNYYCKINGLKYDGPHYMWVEDEGISLDGKRKVHGNRKIPNPQYKLWHYLHRIARDFYRDPDNKNIQWVDCSTGEWNPTHLTKTTEAMQLKRDRIYNKYFGKIHGADVAEIADYVSEITDTMDPMQIKHEMEQLDAIKQMSDKSKRAAAAEECRIEEILKRKGRNQKEKLDK